MLVKLLPEQIASNWDFLKTCIVEDVPLERGSRINRNANILNLLLIDEMQCWVDVRSRGDKTEIRVVVITQFYGDNVSGNRNMLIYSLVGLNSIFDLTTWRKGMLTLLQYARGKGCNQVLAYSDNESVLTFVKRLGANTSQRLIVMSLEA